VNATIRPPASQDACLYIGWILSRIADSNAAFLRQAHTDFSGALDLIHLAAAT
jgi:hypothetical protein